MVFGKKESVLSGSMRSSKKRLRPISSTTKCTLEKQKVALTSTHLHPSTYLTNLMRESKELLTSFNEREQAWICSRLQRFKYLSRAYLREVFLFLSTIN